MQSFQDGVECLIGLIDKILSYNMGLSPHPFILTFRYFSDMHEMRLIFMF
jgi:hypothetical protein